MLLTASQSYSRTCNSKDDNADDVVMVTKTPDGKLMRLENGNSSSGLKHIADIHTMDYANRGISDIPGFLNKVVWTAHSKRTDRLINSGWVVRDEDGNFNLKVNKAYNFTNVALIGIPDTLAGALFPEEPLSAQHWADSIGVALLAIGGSKAIMERNGVFEITANQKNLLRTAKN